MVSDGWLSTAEAAQLLGVTPARVREWALLGRLVGRHGGDGTWAVDPDSVAREAQRIHRASWWRRDG